MNRLFLIAVFAAASGCGPLVRPLPVRLDPDGQKEIDAAWNAALTPVEKYNRQRWLDALIGVQAYQTGVDLFTFRSEKAFDGGKVVMEVFFDSAKPEEDRFVVTVLDKMGKQVRQEKYTRADVEQTAQELFDPSRNPPEITQRRAAADARWKQIEELLPRAKEAGK